MLCSQCIPALQVLFELKLFEIDVYYLLVTFYSLRQTTLLCNI